MQVKNELAIVEEFQSSAWKRTAVREAIELAKYMIGNPDKVITIFSRWKDNDKETGIYKEGWQPVPEQVQKTTTYDYCMVGIRDDGLIESFVTMASEFGKKYLNEKPPCTYWTLFGLFNNIFGHLIKIDTDGSTIVVYNKDEFRELTVWWEQRLAQTNARPMIDVLNNYSLQEWEQLNSMSDEDVEVGIQQLEDIVYHSKTTDTPHLILKGLSGPVVAMKDRAKSRLAFWEQYLKTHDDLRSLAKDYSLVNPKRN